MIWNFIIIFALSLIIFSNASPWPGSNQVCTIDDLNEFPTNLSGLSYDGGNSASTEILWSILNKPSKIFKLKLDTSTGNWISDSQNNWGAGKLITYPNGSGSPDSEDLTRGDRSVPNELYVCTERDNKVSTVSRLSVLRYVDDPTLTTLKATHEWDLTSFFTPSTDANIGLEGIVWVSDEFLVRNRFFDQHLNTLYNPSNYPDHGNGLFFVAYEFDGSISAFTLNHKSPSPSTSFKLASFPSGEKAVMGLSFDEENGYLWTLCDNTCNGRTHIFTLSSSTGVFINSATFDRPSTMGGNYNTEGIAVVSGFGGGKGGDGNRYCNSTFNSTSNSSNSMPTTTPVGMKPVFFTDDDCDLGHALRMDYLPCGSIL